MSSLCRLTAVLSLTEYKGEVQAEIHERFPANDFNVGVFHINVLVGART